MIEPDMFVRNINPILEMTRAIYNRYDDLLKWNHDSESVMDVGIGEGYLSTQIIIPRLPENFKEYYGCDISKAAIQEARNTLNISNCQLVNLDIATKQLPLELVNRFDHVFSNRCLHNVRNIRQAYKNIYNLLKPGGQFFITTFAESPLDHPFERLDTTKWAKYDHWKVLSPFYGSENAVEDMKKVIQETGFTDVHINQEPDYAITFSNQAFWEAHVPVNPIISSVLDNDKNAYIQDFINVSKKGRLVRTLRLPEEEEYEVVVQMIVAVATKPKE